MFLNRLFWSFWLYMIIGSLGLPHLAQAQQRTASIDAEWLQIEKDFKEVVHKKLDDARPLAARAMVLATKQDNPLWKAKANEYLGYLEYLSGNYEQSMAYQLSGIKWLESVGATDKLARALCELATATKKFGDFEKALDYLRKARIYSLESKDSTTLGITYDNSGIIYMMQEKFDLAKAAFDTTLLIRNAIKDKEGLGYVYNNISWHAHATGQINEAVLWLEASNKIRQDLGDEQGLAVNLNNMGEILVADNRPAEAIVYLQQSLVKSTAVGYNDLRRHTMELMAKAYESTGALEPSLKWYKASQALKDSLYDNVKTQQISELQIQYETANKEKALVESQLELRNRNIWLMWLAAACLLLAIMAAAVYWQQKEKQRRLAQKALFDTQTKLQRERIRISRDLHDHLGAELTIVSSAIARKAFTEKEPENASFLEQMLGGIRMAMHELRSTIWAISQEDTSVQALGEQLQRFIDKIELPQIELTIENDNNPSLSPIQSLHMFRIGQEAITNASKYAQAKKISVHLRASEKEVRLSVVDDGVGIASTSSLGYGMGNMQERANEISASLAIESKLNSGTRVEMFLPL